jgi:hypothetical protein
MSYIGRGIDQIDNISTLDNLTFNGSDATFNLTQNSVAFVPVSADALQIQIDGVIQANNFTISGSTVTFDFTPNSGSVCNSIKHFGVGLLTTVSDGAITNVKLGADSVNGSKIADDSISDEHLDITAITGQTAITSLADTDKFLVSDASDSGNLKYVEKQYLPSGTFVEIADSKNVNATGNITLDNIFTSDYIMYKIFGVFVPATNGDSLLMTLRSSAPADLTGNNYRYVVNAVRNPSNNSVETGYNSNDGTSSFNLHYGGNNSGVDYPMNFEINMFDPRSSFVAGKNINYRCSFYGNDSKMYISVGAGTYKASGDAYGFKLAFSSGDIKRHKVTVFGIKGTDIA